MTTEVIGTEGGVRVVSYEGQAWINTDGEDVAVEMDRDAARARSVAAFINREAGNPEDAPLAQSAIEQTSGILDEVAVCVSAINSGSALPVSNAHARKVIEVILAVEESAKTGREVRLDNGQ